MAPENHFDRRKPFYPLVVSYFCQLVGFKELALRWFIGPWDADTLLMKALSLGRVEAVGSTDRAVLRKQLEVLAGPVNLASSVRSDHLNVPLDALAHEASQNHPSTLPSVMDAAGSVLILAHEVSKDRPWHSHDPIWEFLRHCRNAAAHGGRFNLRNGEPRRSAHWRTLRIDSSMQGSALIHQPPTTGLLRPWDPILLLWDLEQAHPEMER